MKILVLGARGMVGHVVFRWLKDQYAERAVLAHIYRGKVDHPARAMNLYDNTTGLERLLSEIEPNVVVNCVGVLPAQAEKEPEKAAYLNAFLPHFLSAKADRVIQISTDCVWAGKDDVRFKTENYPKDESGIYGVTKSAGELDNDKDFTIRTSIVGPELKRDGSGLFSWLMRQDAIVHGWTNAFWNGVTTLELAKFVQEAIDNKYTGIYNLASDERISKYHLLSIFKKVYEKDIHIGMKVLDFSVDKTIISARDDILYRPRSIENLITELKEWY